MYHSTFKRIYSKSKTEQYVYISSSLKDSYVRGDRLIIGDKDSAYTVPIFQFKERLSKRTLKAGTVPVMYKVLDGVDGSPTEARVIIRVPWGWTVESFQTEALREWGKNPSVDMVASCHSAESVDMDLLFLTRKWRGDKSIRLADTDKRSKR